jgi:phosphate transport system permease protein
MNRRTFTDILAQRIMFLMCLGVLSIAFFMVGGLLYRSHPVLAEAGLRQLLFSNDWRPTQGHFGMAGFIAGSLWVTAIAVVIAVPLSILTATYLSEYAHRRIRECARPIVDLLAGISHVVYGAWGVIAVVPLVRDYLMPFLSSRFPFFPFVSENYTGYTALTGGLVLSIMIFPIVISIIEEVMKTIPREIREAALALGATKWQMVKHVVFKKARPGIIAAVILGLSRAFGETMAVLMVAGCCLQGFPKSIFDPAYPLPALIANTYGEMMSIPLFDAAVLLAALVLLLVTIVFNVLGWLILLYFQRKEARYG